MKAAVSSEGGDIIENAVARTADAIDVQPLVGQPVTPSLLGVLSQEVGYSLLVGA